MPHQNEFKREFLNQIQPAQHLHSLFDFLHDICYWIKDTEGKYVVVNQAFVEKCKCNKEEDVIGKTDYDFFQSKYSIEYCEDDSTVIKTGKEIQKKMELISNPDGSISWHCTNKIPVFGKNGDIIGVGGTTHIASEPIDVKPTADPIKRVFKYIHNNYEKNITNEELAHMAKMPKSVMLKKFRTKFNTSPHQYVIHTKIKNACNMLATSSLTISKIADQVGFYDTSYFCKKFSNHMGITPKTYRKKFRGELC